MTSPLLPGATGLTHLRVYDSPAPDGVPGGSPHFHLVCTEAYVVLAGRGAVLTLDATGIAEHELSPGRVVWFSPGVIHRLLNHGRDLEILVIMQNAGLPESGDFVLTFPPDVVDDPQSYAESAALVQGDFVYARGAEAAARRRDLAVRGFAGWRERFEQQGPAALAPLYAAGLRHVAPRLAQWRDLYERGPRAAAADTAHQLDAIARGVTAHLLRGRVGQMPAPPAGGNARPLGMCGTLGLYQPEGALVR